MCFSVSPRVTCHPVGQVWTLWFGSQYFFKGQSSFRWCKTALFCGVALNDCIVNFHFHFKVCSLRVSITLPGLKLLLHLLTTRTGSPQAYSESVNGCFTVFSFGVFVRLYILQL